MDEIRIKQLIDRGEGLNLKVNHKQENGKF